MDHFERALVLPDLQEFVDEILVRLQLAQELGEILAGAVKLLDRCFGRCLELAPPLDQELGDPLA